MGKDSEDVAEMPLPVAISEDLVGVREHKTPGTSILDFDGILQPPLKLHEDVKEGCGGQPWVAGMVLAKYLLRKPQLESLQGRRILELGAGSGLVGLAIACALRKIPLGLDGTLIHMTDQQALLPLLQRNIELNYFLDGHVTGDVLDWGTCIDGNEYHPDIVLAAECVYFEPAFPLLLQTLKALLGQTTMCYFCFKKRRKADLRFVKEARKMFKVEDVQDDPDRESWSRNGLFMYLITRKP